MFNSIPIGKYGKYLALAQTAFDIIIVNAVFFTVILAGSYNLLEIAPVRFTVSMEIGAIVTSSLFYFVHRRRMMRAERKVRLAVMAATLQTVVMAASMMIMGSPNVAASFFIWVWAIQICLYVVVWLCEMMLLKHLRKSGRNTFHVVIFGTGTTAREFADWLSGSTQNGVNIMGFFSEAISPNFIGTYLGGVQELRNFCMTKKPDAIYYASSHYDQDLINSIIKISDDTLCPVFILPLSGNKLKHKFFMVNLDESIPVIGVHPSPLRSSVAQFTKRAFDIAFSGACLLLSPIVLIPVAIAIKLSSPGPVFFKQMRTGYRGRDFVCYKFRTMKVNAEADSVQATKDDNRKTRLGNFLRHSSIDELPQFWNVFKGDMSVVGPRPHMLAHTESYRKIINQYMVRHLVKPGITGLAQISGCRGATDELWQMEKRVDFDVWYIEHWSFLLDLKIIVKTVTNALHGEENAY